jgi:hypothetical protein
MGGFIYMGPGAGIVLSGLAASGMVAWQWTAAGAWLVFGALAFVLSALAWRFLQGGNERLQPLAARSPEQFGQVPADRQTVQAGHSAAEMMLLTLAYGLAGFGYIITATFLPVIARSALPGSHWLDLFWPLFGAGVMLGAWGATRLRSVADYRWLLLGGYLVQALAIAISLWSPSLAGFAIGSLLLGIPFTANTFFAMQEARRLQPASASSFMGLMTATYGMVAASPAFAGRWVQVGAGNCGCGIALGCGAVCLVGTGVPACAPCVSLEYIAFACCHGAQEPSFYRGHVEDYHV